MKSEEKWLSIGDKFGLAGVIALIAGCGLYGFGVENLEGSFQASLLSVAIVVAVVGVVFLVLSYRAHMLSWQTSTLNKAVATAILLFLASILAVIIISTPINIFVAVVIAVLGVVCLAFAIWKWIRLLKSR